MAHRGLKALLEAETQKLTANEFRRLGITRARDDEEAARSVYSAIKKSFPEAAQYIGFIKGNPDKGIEPALRLLNHPK